MPSTTIFEDGIRSLSTGGGQGGWGLCTPAVVEYTARFPQSSDATQVGGREEAVQKETIVCTTANKAGSCVHSNKDQVLAQPFCFCTRALCSSPECRGERPVVKVLAQVHGKCTPGVCSAHAQSSAEDFLCEATTHVKRFPALPPPPPGALVPWCPPSPPPGIQPTLVQ